MMDQDSQRAIRFDGQVVVVTGAGRGLGAAYARLLAARGASVVVHDAGVAQDGSGFDPSVADNVAASIAAEGGTAVACHENLSDPATPRFRQWRRRACCDEARRNYFPSWSHPASRSWRPRCARYPGSCSVRSRAGSRWSGGTAARALTLAWYQRRRR